MKKRWIIPGNHPLLQLERRGETDWVPEGDYLTVCQAYATVKKLSEGSRVVLVFRAMLDGTEIVTYFAAMGKAAYSRRVAEDVRQHAGERHNVRMNPAQKWAYPLPWEIRQLVRCLSAPAIALYVTTDTNGIANPFPNATSRQTTRRPD